MTFTTISSTARRSLIGAAVALALAVAFVAHVSSAKAATDSPIGQLDNAGGPAWEGVVSGWAADLDVPPYSPISVRVDVYRPQWRCYKGVCWLTTQQFLVGSQTQTANAWNSEASTELARSYGVNIWNGYHGFSFVLDPYYGDETACVTALNVGPGGDTPLGCVSPVWIG